MLRQWHVFCTLSLSLALLASGNAAHSDELASVSPHHGPTAVGAQPEQTEAASQTGQEKAQTQQESQPSAAPPPRPTAPAAPSESPSAPAIAPAQGAAPPAPPSLSQQLNKVYDAYRLAPSAEGLAQVWKLTQQLIASKGAGAALIKSTSALSDMGARCIEAGGGRIWTFAKLGEPRQLILQWTDTKSTVTFTGKRHRKRHVVTTTVGHSGTLTLPANVTVDTGRILGGGAHSLILVGAENGSDLWLHTYRLEADGWQASRSNLDSVPAFLTHNVSGTVSFRGADLIFNVAPVVRTVTLGERLKLPAAESATYKFWLHLTEQGYVLVGRLPDEEQFWVVRQFMEAFAQGHSDAARALLTDEKLLSIPKYVGIKAPADTFRVVEMASPPSGAPRFRLVTGGKDDLIFEVVHLKDRTAIRAIFIAAADPFLEKMAAMLPRYGATPEAHPSELSAEKH